MLSGGLADGVSDAGDMFGNTIEQMMISVLLSCTIQYCKCQWSLQVLGRGTEEWGC